ncbi:MAG: Rne/Rng family ribonuclease [Acidimicrobiia bacterium]|nr:Rne/Rng family ribonuclease [Acidimicrobiia bacterium]
MEDAGLRAPRIGDTRPAPVSAPVSTPASTPASSQKSNSTPSQQADGSENSEEGQSTSDGTSPPRKRRRRGGKGRGRGGSRPTGTGGTSGAVVTADLNDDGTSVLDTLDEETLERRRGRTRKGRPTGRYQMVVRVDADGTIQMAVLEGRMLVEHYVSRKEDDAASIDGNIYLGKVQNVLPGMEAAFVDIGTPKNGVIYQRDVQFDASVVEGADQAGPKIETVLRNGQSILVQVTKNPIGAKGARLTQEVSLAGRFVVLVPGQPTTYGISKRLPDDERKRLRKVLEGLRPVDAGLIVRTAAEGATADELQRDVARLQNQWEQISALAARSKPGSLLYREPALVVRVIREEFTKEYRSIVIDDEAMFADVKSYVDAIAPELSERVEFYEEKDLPVFERFHVHEQLHKALDRKVWLPSGGSLIIERTEALTVIDVNTGKNVGRTNLEETVFANNVEAAGEIGRQLRLRDIGGIIVIDFIDMEIRKNRDEVVRALKEALSRDKTRTQVFDISDLGLVEMTRKRISEGLVEAFSETCTVCGGRGFTVDESML